MPRLARSLLAVTAVAALLLGSTACATGSHTEKDFDSWIADHPVKGAKVSSRSGTNSIFGHGEFFVTYVLTAKPSESAIKTAMSGACGFDSQTKAATSYALVIDAVTLEVACRPENQTKVAHFWTAVRDLDVKSLTFSQGAVSVSVASVADAVSSNVIETVVDAASVDGLITDGSFTMDGDGPAINTTIGDDLSGELALVHAIVKLAGAHLNQVSAIPKEVLAVTDGTVAEARSWEDAANADGPRLLVVSSAKTGWSRLPSSKAMRDLVDQVASRDDVSRVTIPTQGWQVDVDSLDHARGLVTSLAKPADAKAAKELGPLQLSPKQDSSTGCTVVVDPGAEAVGQRLLDLCAIDGVAVNQVVGEDARVVVPAAQQDKALAVMHRMPRGTQLNVVDDAQPYPSALITVDQPLVVRQPSDAAYAKKLTKIWDGLGPLG